MRPSAKREKKKRKRLADPSRKTYMGIMKESGVSSSGSQVLNNNDMDKLVGSRTGTGGAGGAGEASEHEALAVAEAIGLPGTPGAFAAFRKERNPSKDEDGEPLSRVTSGRSDYTSEPESPSPTGYLSPDPPLEGEVRSPEFERLESPLMSEEEDGSDDDGNGVGDGDEVGGVVGEAAEPTNRAFVAGEGSAALEAKLERLAMQGIGS